MRRLQRCQWLSPKGQRRPEAAAEVAAVVEARRLPVPYPWLLQCHRRPQLARKLCFKRSIFYLLRNPVRLRWLSLSPQPLSEPHCHRRCPRPHLLCTFPPSQCRQLPPQPLLPLGQRQTTPSSGHRVYLQPTPLIRLRIRSPAVPFNLP